MNRQEDHLKEDPIIRNQQWAVVSILNPKDRVLAKNIFYVNRFLVADVNKELIAQASHMVKKLQAENRNRIKDTLERLQYSSNEEDKHLFRILSDKFASMQIDEDEFIQECHRKYTIDDEEILDKFKMYITQNRSRLDGEFDDANNDETSVRGFKIRGSFRDYESACEHAKYCRDTLEPAISAYVVNVGKWFPVEFENDEVDRQEYAMEELNNMMGKYHEGVRARNEFYKDRKFEMAAAANESKSDSKTKMQELLRKRRLEKTRAEIEQFKNAQDGTSEREKQDFLEKEKAAAKMSKQLISEEAKEKKSKSKSKTKISKSAESSNADN